MSKMKDSTFQLAREFIKAADLSGSQPSSLGTFLHAGMTAEEKDEYSWDLPRNEVHWAEFISRVAIRQGYTLDALTVLLPSGPVDPQSVVDLVATKNLNFAQVVALAATRYNPK